MYVFLSPSTQEYNIDALGTSEKEVMNYIADEVEPYLIDLGIPFVRNFSASTVSQSIFQANAGDYDLYVALHTTDAPIDANGSMRGAGISYFPTSQNGKRAAESFAKNYKSVYPLPDEVRLFADGSNAELKLTRAPAVYISLGFSDNIADAEFVHKNIGAIARAVAKSIAEYYGIHFLA